ncbi:9963_t:CDS:2, partial [Gigaspora rosea]
SSEATTSQQEDNNVVEWNRLRTADLKAMCFKCGLRAEGSKTKLQQPEIGKGKSTNQNVGEEYVNEPLSQEEIDNQNEAFFIYFNTKVNGVGAIESSFSKKKFRKTRDQYEKRLRLRAFTLRVAEEEGWTVARKILKLIPNEGDEFKDLLVEARKQAKSQEGYSVPYSRRVWQTKGKKFEVGVQEQITIHHIHSPTLIRKEKRTGEYEERGDEQRKARQKGGWKDLRTRGSEDLSQKAKALAKEAVSLFYKAKAEKYWATIGLYTKSAGPTSGCKQPTI